MNERDFGIDASDFRQAAKALEKQGFEKQAGRTVAWGLRQSANAVRRHVRAELKPHRKTGRMSSNVRVRFRGAGLGFVAGVKSTGSGSNLIVGGVRPHEIASDRIMPMWGGKGRSSGITGFARVVQHPGFAADPFFHRGVQAAKDEINVITQRSADTMAKELAYRMKGKA